jgi:hypothetical protein
MPPSGSPTRTFCRSGVTIRRSVLAVGNLFGTQAGTYPAHQRRNERRSSRSATAERDAGDQANILLVVAPPSTADGHHAYGTDVALIHPHQFRARQGCLIFENETGEPDAK